MLPLAATGALAFLAFLAIALLFGVIMTWRMIAGRAAPTAQQRPTPDAARDDVDDTLRERADGQVGSVENEGADVRIK